MRRFAALTISATVSILLIAVVGGQGRPEAVAVPAMTTSQARSFSAETRLSGSIEGVSVESVERLRYAAPDSIDFESDGEGGMPVGFIAIGDSGWRKRGQSWMPEDAQTNRDWLLRRVFGLEGVLVSPTDGGPGPKVEGEPTRIYVQTDKACGSTVIKAIRLTATPSIRRPYALDEEFLGAMTEPWQGVGCRWEFTIGSESGRMYFVETAMRGPRLTVVIRTEIGQYDEEQVIRPPQQE